MSTVHVILPGTTPGMSSREQFMPAYEGRSLFQLCIEYNSSFADRQLVVGNHDYYAYAKDYFKLTGNKTYLSIIEEDYFASIYSVTFAAFSANPDEILLITPSNYTINDVTAYWKAIKEMISIAKDGQISVSSFSLKHVGYSVILCCKAGIYLQELKKWAPEVYLTAMRVWEARVAQYVSIDAGVKVLQASLEESLLMLSDKVQVVGEIARLPEAVKNNK